MRISIREIGVLTLAMSAWLSAAPMRAGASDLIVVQIVPHGVAIDSNARAFADGARLYFDRVNARGGVAGARIAFEMRDDDGAAIAAALRARQPVLIVGPIGRDRVDSVLPLLERLQVPLLGPAVESGRFSAHDSRYLFTIEPDPVAEIDTLLDKIGGLGLRKTAVCAPGDAAVAYASGVPFASLQRGAAPIAARCDGTPADVEAAARSIAATRPQAVVVGGSTRDATIFVRALRAHESRAMVVTTSAIDVVELTAALSPSARTWIVGGESVPTVRRGRDGAATSAAAQFLEARGAAGSTLAVSRASLAGFTTARMAVEAMRRAGPNPSGADIRNALAAMQRYDAERLAANDVRDGIAPQRAIPDATGTPRRPAN